MAQKFLTNIDLNKNELQNAKIQNLATAPSSPVDGQIYFDTVSDSLKVWNGTAWIDLQQQGDVTAVTAGTGLTGGGSSGEVTLSIDTTGVTADTYGSGTEIPVITVNAQGQITTASTASISTTLGIAGDTGTDSVALATDTLTFSGATGITTSVATDTVTIDLDDTAVTPGSYGSASAVSTFTVDQQGRLTAAGSTNISITSSAVSNFAEAVQDVVGGQLVTNGVHTGISAVYDDAGDGAIDLSLTNTGVTNGTYGSASEVASFTVDSKGRLSSASNVSISITASQVSDLSSNAVTSISGTANEVTVDVSTGSVQVGLPDSVTITSDLTVGGDLTVNGTVTTINSTTLSVDDKNIELGSVTSPNDTTANGGGITLKGATDKTFNWVSSTGSWTSSENLDLASGKTFKIAGSDVLSATTLGSSVVSSSLTSVGTITTGVWQATDVGVAHGGTGASTAAGAKTNLGFMTRYAANIGDGSATAIAVNHSLNTEDIVVEVYDNTSKETVVCDVDRTGANEVTLRFASAPALNSLRVVVIG